MHTLKTAILTLLIQLMSYSNTLAQGKWVEGSIITNQNDTIQGLIRDADWTESPESVQFKGEDGLVTTISAANAKAFNIGPDHDIYKSKKVGLLRITVTDTYKADPSLETSDSVQVFLQEVVAGSKASLYLYLNALEEPHFFVEKDHVLKELYYYPFNKIIRNTTYLLTIDEYKNQLKKLTENTILENEPIPVYQEKYLKKYLEKYNNIFPDNHQIYQSKDSKLTCDIDINTGFENWKEDRLVLNNKFTFGVGIRINLPRKHYNRHLKINYFLTPNLLVHDQNSYRKALLTTLEIGVGSYFGAKSVRPYVGFHYSIASGGYRFDFLGLQAGMSYKRRFNLEIGHFANVISPFYGTRFLTLPRISLHYFINLNVLRNKSF
jgi:hypothetical protein